MLDVVAPLTPATEPTRAAGPGAAGGRELFLATFLVGTVAVVLTALASVVGAVVAAQTSVAPALVVAWLGYGAWVLVAARRAVARRHGRGEAVAATGLVLAVTPLVVVGPVLAALLP